MKAPSLTDRRVKVRAYLSDEEFAYDNWHARQFASPIDAKPALLLIFDTEEERDHAAGGGGVVPSPEPPRSCWCDVLHREGAPLTTKCPPCLARAVSAVPPVEPPRWQDAVKTILRGFDEGVFVRNTDGDGDPAWGIKLLPFIHALAVVQELLPLPPTEDR